MLAEASRVLRPGGLIFLGEWIHRPIDSTGESPSGVTAFCQALDNSLLDEYGIPNIPPHLAHFISQLGTFDDIQAADFYMPIGDWAPRVNDLGLKFRQTLRIWAKSAAVVIARTGYDEVEVDGLVEGFINDIFSIPGLQIAYRVVTARRVAN